MVDAGAVEQSSGPLADAQDRRPFVIFLILLALAPLPYGANRPWAWLPLAAAMFLLGAWVAVIPRPSRDSDAPSSSLYDNPDAPTNARSSAPHLEPVYQRGHRCWMGLWGLWLAYSLFQLVPLAPDTLQVLEPGLHELYAQMVPGYAEGRVWHAIAVNPAHAQQSVLILGAAGVVFWLAGRLCRTRQRVEWLASTIVAVGVAEAICGLIHPGKILAQGASGTFIDHSHYGTLLGMALMVAIALWLGTRQERQGRWGALNHGGLAPDVLKGILQVISILFVSAGILFSLSRAGVASAAVGTVVLVGCWVARQRRGRLRMAGSLLAMFMGLLLIGGITALDVLSARYARAVPNSRDVQARVEVWTQTLKLIESVPRVGVGLGGYEDAFTRYATPSPTFEHLTWDHAHSDPLELVAESGWLGAGWVITSAALYVSAMLYRWVRRHDPFATTLGCGCLLAVGVGVLNSLFNFPFHIPAIALYAAVLLALGWRAVHCDAAPRLMPSAN